MPPPKYCFGFLNTHPERPSISKEEAEKIQAAHIGHLEALGNKRYLVAAGPLVNGGSIRGLLISKCASVQEMNQLSSQDPAVVNKRLTVESYRWAGPDGIGDPYWEAKAKDPNAPDKMAKHPILFWKKPANWKGWPSKEVFEAHFRYAQSIESKVRAMGPFTDGGQWLGVFVFAPGMTLDEVKQIVSEDPMVKGGHVAMQMYEWFVASDVFPVKKN